MLIDFDHTQSLIIILIQDCLNGSGFACSSISKQQAVIGFLTFHKCLCILDQLLLGNLVANQIVQVHMRDSGNRRDHRLPVFAMLNAECLVKAQLPTPKSL